MLDKAIEIIRQATCDRYRNQLFLVGGLLRDRILGIKPDEDIDIVCLANALEVSEYLHQAGVTDHSPVVFPRFQTAMVGINSVQVEFATARRESYNPDSRKPVCVEPATLEEDALRRDFTVNTLVENLHTGEVLDLTGQALKDLTAKIIRTPLDPVVTFQDDPLRMLRAVRFSSKLSFSIEPSVYQAIIECAGRLDIISRERIRDELNRILLNGSASKGLELLRQTGLLATFAPELAAMHGVTQNIYHLYDVWEHTLKAIEALPEDADLKVRLGMLFHDVGKPATRTQDADGSVHFYGHQQVGAQMTADILKRLKYPNDVIDDVTSIVALHMRIGEYDEKWSDAAVRRLIRDFGDRRDALFTISSADKAACNPEYHYLDNSVVLERIEKVQAEADYAKVTSPLNGREIMSIAGTGQGPLVGLYKEMLINEILEGRLAPDDKQTAETLLKEFIRKQHGGEDQQG